jgi:hypothetical protein
MGFFVLLVARARGLNNDYKGLGQNVKTYKSLYFQLKQAFFFLHAGVETRACGS